MSMQLLEQGERGDSHLAVAPTMSGYDPRYHLAPEEVASLEARLIGNFTDEHPEVDLNGVVVFSVDPRSIYADIGRTHETNTFVNYDSSVAMQRHECRSTFLYTVKDEKIAHIKRLVVARQVDFDLVAFRGSQVKGGYSGGSGIETIDDRLFAPVYEEGASAEDIAEYHGIKDFSRLLNVTSNMSVPGMEPTKLDPYSMISYKAVFQFGLEREVTHIFAYLNSGAVRSLGKLGVRSERVNGREFHLPDSSKPGGYDHDYLAVCMPFDEPNMAAFTTTSPEYPMRRAIATREVPMYPIGAQ